MNYTMLLPRENMINTIKPIDVKEYFKALPEFDCGSLKIKVDPHLPPNSWYLVDSALIEGETK